MLFILLIADFSDELELSEENDFFFLTEPLYSFIKDVSGGV